MANLTRRLRTIHRLPTIHGPRSVNTLVVVCHPKPESLTRAGLERLLAGLESAGQPVRVLDLDAEHFDPRLTRFEVVNHLGRPEDRPDLAHHVEALRWATRLVLVHPTWFSGQPARLKGWFDRVWMHGVAFDLPPGANRIRGRLANITEIVVVTTTGSSRLVNFVQGDAGRVRVRRNLRALCHWRCRTRWIALHRVDQADHATRREWLDRLELLDWTSRPVRG